MKKKIIIAITVFLVIVLGIVIWLHSYYNHKNTDNIPSKELMLTYLQEKGEQYATEQLIGCSRDSLRYIWDEPDIMLSGLWGEGWNVDNMEIVVFYDTDNKVESVKLVKSGFIFEATILEIKDNYLLVEPVEGSSELKSADQIIVPMKNMNPSPEPEVGDIIEIKYDGTIAESYPVQITEVYSIRVVKEAAKEAFNDKPENTVEKTTETEVIETAIVYPLPTTFDLNNIKDCTLAVSIENGDIYVTEADTRNYTMKVRVYDYELFDLVDISLLEVGNVILINKEQVEISSIERNELGTVIINGGLDVGGYELVTNENGVFYSIGYSDIKIYHEIGEIELEISPEFIYIDASDPDSGEKKYTVADLTADDAFFEYKGNPHNTSIVVENGLVTSMTKSYTP